MGNSRNNSVSFFFNWSVVDLQCSVPFWYIAKWYTFFSCSFPLWFITGYWVKFPVPSVGSYPVCNGSSPCVWWFTSRCVRVAAHGRVSILQLSSISELSVHCVFFCPWTCRLFPCLRYCECCSYEHTGSRICSELHFCPGVCPEWHCWIIW